MPLSSQPERYVPKHRRPPERRASRAAVRTTFLLSGAAVVGTGAVVAGGTVSLTPEPAGADASLAGAGTSVAQVDAGTSADTSATTSAGSVVARPRTAPGERETGPAADDPADDPADDRRTAPVSRSDRRGAADPRKQAALAVEAADNALTRSEDASDEDPRTVAAMLVGDATQFGCLDSLWTKESGWRVDADNPTSSAYGIPQALPGSKMSSAGADWATNPVTQIRWGLGYIEDRYGSPCSAWSHSQSFNFY